MSEPIPKEPAALWKAQPEERTAVNLEQIVERRTEQLHASTRSEILMSIGAAVLFAVVMAWRFAQYRDRFLDAGIAAVAAWALISLAWFRRWIWPRERVRPDAAAATGAEYYGKQLERRRDHLRNEWLWHGPLFLACLILVWILTGRAYLGFNRLAAVVPLLVLLALWTVFGVWRRLRQAREIQREIDELQRGQVRDC
jgi:hypothetical protein